MAATSTDEEMNKSLQDFIQILRAWVQSSQTASHTVQHGSMTRQEMLDMVIRLQESGAEKEAEGIFPTPVKCYTSWYQQDTRSHRPRITLKRKHIHAARFMMYLKYFVNSMPFYTVKDVTVSHLCHEARCVNPYHLCFESQGYNQSRINCPSFLQVEERRLLLCSHQPVCICPSKTYQVVRELQSYQQQADPTPPVRSSEKRSVTAPFISPRPAQRPRQ